MITINQIAKITFGCLEAAVFEHPQQAFRTQINLGYSVTTRQTHTNEINQVRSDQYTQVQKGGKFNQRRQRGRGEIAAKSTLITISKE